MRFIGYLFDTLLDPPFSFEQTTTISDHLYDTISLALHLSSFLAKDPTRYKMNLHILLEIESNFLPRLNSMSIDDDINVQYQFDILTHQCRLLRVVSTVEKYLGCLRKFHGITERLHEDGNIYYLIDAPALPTSNPSNIKIGRRLIRSTDLYEQYENHGEYLCDIGYQDEGIKFLELILPIIMNERAGKCLHQLLLSYSLDMFSTGTVSHESLEKINSVYASILSTAGLCAFDYSRKLQNNFSNSDMENISRYQSVAAKYLSGAKELYSSQLNLLVTDQVKYQLIIEDLNHLSSKSEEEGVLPSKPTLKYMRKKKK